MTGSQYLAFNSFKNKQQDDILVRILQFIKLKDPNAATGSLRSLGE